MKDKESPFSKDKASLSNLLPRDHNGWQPALPWHSLTGYRELVRLRQQMQAILQPNNPALLKSVDNSAHHA